MPPFDKGGGTAKAVTEGWKQNPSVTYGASSPDWEPRNREKNKEKKENEKDEQKRLYDC